jgi:hypothetical protein
VVQSRNLTIDVFRRWIDDTFFDLARQLRWSYLPPLLVYLAAGVSGLTAVVGTFFIKEYLDLSAAFLAGLAFWAGIPWALKMPLGHLVLALEGGAGLPGRDADRPLHRDHVRPDRLYRLDGGVHGC